MLSYTVQWSPRLLQPTGALPPTHRLITLQTRWENTGASYTTLPCTVGVVNKMKINEKFQDGQFLIEVTPLIQEQFSFFVFV